MGAIFYRLGLAADNYFGTPTASDDFADEVNIYAEWTISDQVSISALYAEAYPRAAAEQAFGDEERFRLLEVYLLQSW